MKNCTTLTHTKQVLTTISSIPHQLFYSRCTSQRHELKIYFYKELSNVTWEEFLTTKLGYRSIHNPAQTAFFMAVGGRWRKAAFYFKLKKQHKPVMVILHTSWILTIEK